MDIREYVWTHPPRCLAGFKAQPIELPGVEFDGHPSMSAFAGSPYADKISAPEHCGVIFLLYCACGSDKHYVRGVAWRNPDNYNALVYLSPIALRCAGCGKITELFDESQHGYDAETSPDTVGSIEGARAEYVCDECGPESMEVCARFEFSDDLFTDGNPDWRGREQDLFSWFSLVGKCKGCSRLLRVTEFECA